MKYKFLTQDQLIQCHFVKIGSYLHHSHAHSTMRRWLRFICENKDQYFIKQNKIKTHKKIYNRTSKNCVTIITSESVYCKTQVTLFFANGQPNILCACLYYQWGKSSENYPKIHPISRSCICEYCNGHFSAVTFFSQLGDLS